MQRYASISIGGTLDFQCAIRGTRHAAFSLSVDRCRSYDCRHLHEACTGDGAWNSSTIHSFGSAASARQQFYSASRTSADHMFQRVPLRVVVVVVSHRRRPCRGSGQKEKEQA
jgi:hypothetical protein